MRQNGTGKTGMLSCEILGQSDGDTFHSLGLNTFVTSLTPPWIMTDNQGINLYYAKEEQYLLHKSCRSTLLVSL